MPIIIFVKKTIVISYFESCHISCTACSHRYLIKDESLIRKHNFLKDKLPLWIDKIEPVHSVNDSERFNYRDRVSLAMQYSNMRWNIGLMRNETVIPIHNCPIHTQRINNVIHLLLTSLPDAGVFPAVRMVQGGRQLVLILKNSKLPFLDWVSPNFRNEFFKLGMEGLWIHLFPSFGKKIFGKGNWFLIAGNATSIDDNGLLYGPAAFQQLLPKLANEALDKAADFLKPDFNSLVVDLYCGTGSSLKRWKNANANTIGIELSGDAVNLAIVNVPPVKVLRGTCSQRIPQLNDWVCEMEEVIPDSTRLLYANPPRTGLEPDILAWLISSYKPTRMAYLSCNALTLRNDLSFLTINGFTINHIIPYDFFPNTRHVESLVLLEKRG